MQTKVMECKSHNIAIHLFSNGANDDVFYLRRAADRACLGNVELETQRVSGWPCRGWGCRVGEGGSHAGTSQQWSSFCAQEHSGKTHCSCSHTPETPPFGAHIEHSEA